MESLSEEKEKLIQNLLEAYEKKKTYNREYRRMKRETNREAVNKYKRELYHRKKQELNKEVCGK
jgi:hypothetical protein